MALSTTRVILLERDALIATRIRDSLESSRLPYGRIFAVELYCAMEDLLNDLEALHHAALILVATRLDDVQDQQAIEQLVACLACTESPASLVLMCEEAAPQELVQDAMMRGAGDVIEKSRIDDYWFPRALHSCIETAEARRAMATILRASEDALFAQQERAQVTLNSIGDAVLTTNLAGKITYLNPVAEAMTGWTLQEVLGLPLEDIFSVIDGDTREPHPNPVRRALKANKTVKLPGNSLLVRRDGIEIPIEDSVSPIHDRHQAVSGAVMVFHDVSDARAMAKKILHMAQHDVLTGLANRSLLTERLSRALGLAKRKNKKVGLLFIDVDRFKNINDSCGHAVGDRLLQSIARRLESLVRTTDTVCRQGGDEFVVLLTEIAQVEDAAQVAEKMLSAFIKPHQIQGLEIVISLSIGIGIYPDHGEDIDALFHHADAAMYAAKMGGRNNYLFYGDVGNASVAIAHS